MSKYFQMCESSRECEHRRNELIKHETQKTVSDWATNTFGYPKSTEVAIQRMLVECKELEDKLESGAATHEDIADEIADIVICGYQVMNTLGFNMNACVDFKMDINRHRKWKLNGDGTGSHIKE